MRLPKAKTLLLSVALFAFLFALIFAQCIFVVSDTAYAEETHFEELIPEYFSFYAPTHVAAGGGYIAVFDGGEIVLFSDSSVIRFDSGLTECHKMCVSAAGVFLLDGVSESEESIPVLRAFYLDGTYRPLDIPMDGVTDIALSGETIYTLSSVTKLKGYSASSGVETDSFAPGYRYLSSLAADGETIAFISLLGGVYYKTGDHVTEQNGTLDRNAAHYALHGQDLFYALSGDLYLYGQTTPYMQKTADPETDGAFSAVTDYAISGGRLYLLDGPSRAVKIYDLEKKQLQRMIGSFGRSLGRFTDPVAMDVSDGKIVVADSRRVSVFEGGAVHPLNGWTISAVTDVVAAGKSIFVADGGVLREYNDGYVYKTDYTFGEKDCLYVAAAPDGTVFASAGNEVYAKKAEDSFFGKLLTTDLAIDGLNVGIGGQILYVLTGGSLEAYSREGERLGSLQAPDQATNFAVDYRGNVFFLSGKKVLRYTRTLEGYSAPADYGLTSSYERFSDLVIDKEGNTYVIADHNVLIYQKSAFDVFVAKDSDFADDVPAVSPRFICEVTSDRAIAYAAPDNFEDITALPRGTRLMCYAEVNYAGDEYLRVETEKGKSYVPLADVKIYQEGRAPFSKARCLLPAIGSRIVGVDLYAEPSHLGVKAGVEPLFASLGKDDVFDVISYVAVDEDAEDAWGFLRVSYQGQTAYVLADQVVSVDGEPEPLPKTYRAKAKSASLGKTVPVYEEADRSSKIVARLTDGTEVDLLEEYDKNKKFIKVLYKGEIRYVLSENIGDGGLSGGQILAIVLSVAAAVGSVLTILIMRANKKHRRYHKE